MAIKKIKVDMDLISGILGAGSKIISITASNYVSVRSLCRLYVQQPVLQHRQQKRALFKQKKD